MKAKPINLKSHEVRAILDGSKTQTRRVVKPLRGWGMYNICRPDLMVFGYEIWWHGPETERVGVTQSCPYGKPGDLIYVRETYYQRGHWETVNGKKTKVGKQKWEFIPESHEIQFVEPAEYRKARDAKDPFTVAWHKRLGRFMPRRYSRITLEITDVRMQRLQDITQQDALAEGCCHDGWIPSYGDPDNSGMHESISARSNYAFLWDQINGPESWDANPWVWAVSFKPHLVNVDNIK